MAIAVGISDGIGFGRNTRAALIARGLAEITRLGEARGSDALTLGGLSGGGDLVLTCTGDLSRSRNIGIAIGRGDRPPVILASTDKVAEGVQTSIAAREMGLEAGIELPITNEVCAVLHENKDPRQAVLDLMSRVQRDERWK
jgi:glycerol-3-phosphate dehydrogenase (NAD(P)+)